MSATRTILAAVRSPALGDDATDAELLRRFTETRDEAAFEAIVRRHARLVWGVCHRILGHVQDAEDAFQATFLELARNPEKPRRWGTTTGFLFGVARRVAMKARVGIAARTARPPAPVPAQPQDPGTGAAVRELQAILDEEIGRLPESHRVAFLLCVLEGRSRAEAAAELRVNEGTLSARLARARLLLRERLAKRGVQLAAAVAVADLTSRGAAAPTELVRATVAAGVSGRSAPAVATLVGGLRVRTALGSAVGLIVCAAVAAGLTIGDPPPPKELPPPAAEKPLAKALAADAEGDPLPAGAIARLGYSPRLIGISAFALTQNEKEIIAVSPEGIVKRFDADTGRLLERRQISQRNDVWIEGQSHAWLSADGRIAAIADRAGRDNRLTVWDVPGGKILLRKTSGSEDVGGLALSPDGKTLATVVRIGTKTLLRVYNTSTGSGSDLGDLEYNVYDAEFAADGKRIVVSQISATGQGSFLSCFDVPQRKQLWKLPHQGSRFAVSPDGLTVVSASFKQRGYQVIETDPQTGATTERLEDSAIAHPNVPVRFSPDNHTLLIDYFNDLIWWDLRAGRETSRLAKPTGRGTGYGPSLGAMSADGTKVVTNFGILERWDQTTGKPLFKADSSDGLGGPVEHVAFLAGGKTLFASGWGLNAGVWELATGRLTKSPVGGHTRQFVHTPAGLRSLKANELKPHEIEVFDPIAGQAVQMVGCAREGEFGNNGLRAYALAADGRTLLVTHGCEPGGKENFIVTSWDTASGRRLGRFTAPGNYFISQSPFSPCGRWVVLGRKVYHVPTGAELFTPSGTPGEQLAVSGRRADGPYFSSAVWFSMDGRLLAGRLERTSEDGKKISDVIGVWELASGQLIARFPKTELVAQVVLGPDDRTIAMLDARGVRLYDLLTGRQLAEYSTPDINFQIVARGGSTQTVVFSPDGRTLATGHKDGSITLWAVPRPADTGGMPTWAGLGAGTVVEARLAVERAARDPAAAMKLLTAEFRPPPNQPDPKLAALIADLDNEVFATREAATTKLRDLGATAEPALRRAQAGRPSAESALRLRGLLDIVPPFEVRLPVAGESLQGVRAMEALERVGTPAARDLLRAWADQDGNRRLAAEAQSILSRLGPPER